MKKIEIAGAPIEYKYVKRDGRGNSVWKGSGNRSFTTPASGELVRVDSFRP